MEPVVSSRKYAVTCGIFIVVIALLLAGLVMAVLFGGRGEAKETVKDPSTGAESGFTAGSVDTSREDELTKEITDLTEQNQILSEKLADLEGVTGEEQLMSDVTHFYEVYQTGDYYLQDSEAHDQAQREALAELCTEDALDQLYPKDKDYSWIFEPIPIKPSEMVGDYSYLENRHYPNYHYIVTVDTPKLYFRKKDATHTIVQVYLPRHNERRWVTEVGDGDETVRADDEVYQANVQFVYNAEKNRWLYEKLYTETLYTGDINGWAD